MKYIQPPCDVEHIMEDTWTRWHVRGKNERRGVRIRQYRSQKRAGVHSTFLHETPGSSELPSGPLILSLTDTA